MSFTVRKSKSRCSGISPIQVLLTKNGVRASFSTGHAVKPSEWDSKNQRVRGKGVAVTEINNYLDSVRARLYQLEKELTDRGLAITPQMLRDAYLGMMNCLKGWTLMQMIELHLEDLKYYPLSGFLPSVVSAAFFCKTLNRHLTKKCSEPIGRKLENLMNLGTSSHHIANLLKIPNLTKTP
jgi:hypothetical protein